MQNTKAKYCTQIISPVGNGKQELRTCTVKDQVNIMTPQQNSCQRQQKAEGGTRPSKRPVAEKVGLKRYLPTTERMKPAIQRRRSAPTMAISKALSKTRSQSRDGPLSPVSPDSNSLVRAFSSSTSTFIMDEHVQLTTGLQTQERHLFLFSDLLVIAKLKSSTSLKPKNQVRLCEMWIAFCIDEVCERKTTAENSFVIGWPTTNCVVTFSCSDVREKWLSALHWQIKEMKMDELRKKTFMKVTVMPVRSCTCTLTLSVSNTDTADNVIKMATKQLEARHKQGSAGDYQLWVISGKEDAPYPLIGHEYPFSIITNCLRDVAARVERSNSNVQSQDSHQDDLFEQLPKRKQCQFILKPRPQADVHVTRVTLPRPLKKKKSLIDWAFRRGPHINADNDSQSGSPIIPRKLFGLSLPSICKNGTLPKPIRDMLLLLYHEGPTTKGIFRRSANAKTCKELKEKLNSGNEVHMEIESVFVAAAVITDFLRNIPGSVLSSELYDRWMEGTGNENEEERIQALKKLVEELPEANLLLLRHLFTILRRIEMRSEENQMTAFNLALCIAPNMLWPPGPVGPEEESKSTRKVALLVQYLIENSPRIFGDEVLLLFAGSADVQQENLEDSLDVDLLKQHYSSDDMDSPLSNQERRRVDKGQESDDLFSGLNDPLLDPDEEAKDTWSGQGFFDDDLCKNVLLENNDGTDLSEQLESESLYSSVSSLVGIQSIGSARDRCSSEPSVCLAHHPALSHEPVARQFSCDAAVTHGHIDYLQQLKRLQIESQRLLDDGRGPGSNKNRYVYWRSPQINPRLIQPSSYKMNLSTRSSLSSLSSPTTSPSESSLSSVDSAFSCSDSSVFGRSETVFGNSGKGQVSSPCSPNKIPVKLHGAPSASMARCLEDVDWYDEEAEKDADLEAEQAREPRSPASCPEGQGLDMDVKGQGEDGKSYTSVAYIRKGQTGTLFAQNDREEADRGSCGEAENETSRPKASQTFPASPDTQQTPCSENMKRTKITLYMAPGKALPLQRGGDPGGQELGSGGDCEASTAQEKDGVGRLVQTLKVHIPQTVFYGQNAPLVLQSAARRLHITPGDALLKGSSADSASRGSEQSPDCSVQSACPHGYYRDKSANSKRHRIRIILPPPVQNTVHQYFLHSEAQNCVREAAAVESELIRSRQEWRHRRCTDPQLEDFEQLIFTEESYV